MSLGGMCSFGTMDWYCCLADGHEGPHTSHSMPSDDVKPYTTQASRTETPEPCPQHHPLGQFVAGCPSCFAWSNALSVSSLDAAPAREPALLPGVPNSVFGSAPEQQPDREHMGSPTSRYPFAAPSVSETPPKKIDATLHEDEHVVRHPDGQLMVERVLPYVPTDYAIQTALKSLGKALPYLEDHASHIDGEFDNALTDVRRMFSALKHRVARLSEGSVSEPGAGYTDPYLLELIADETEEAGGSNQRDNSWWKLRALDLRRIAARLRSSTGDTT